MNFDVKQGHVIEVLKGMPAGSVQCCVTSPPYWGLRAYGTEPQIWDDSKCEHVWGAEMPRIGNEYREGESTSIFAGREDKALLKASFRRDRAKCAIRTSGSGQFCQRCGAWRGELGLEPTPQLYIEHLVAVFREVRRVLRDDGVMWVNLGDSMSAGSNFLDMLQRRMKGFPLVVGNRPTIGIAAKRPQVPLDNNGFPKGKLLSLDGVKRVLIKQGHDNFGQVFHFLDGNGYAWLGASVRLMRMNATDLEVVVDEPNGALVTLGHMNADGHAVFPVPFRALIGKKANTPLTIKEPAKPMAEFIRDAKPRRDPVSFDAACKAGLNVYFVDKAVPLGDAVFSMASGGGNFCIAKATAEQLLLTLGDTGFDLAFSGVGHLYYLHNGSVTPYAQLYITANEDARENQAKQELGIPFLVRRALMRDGWICRQTIIWAKPNPTPEGVTDRPTKSHEYLFLLTKKARYYYDADAVREPHETKVFTARQDGARAVKFACAKEGDGKRWPVRYNNPSGRNLRSVWHIATEATGYSHYATFPRKLVTPCIKAGSRLGDTVLDPFNGSGTTGVVALELGRSYVGIDLNEKDCEHTRKRLAAVMPLFVTGKRWTQTVPTACAAVLF